MRLLDSDGFRTKRGKSRNFFKECELSIVWAQVLNGGIGTVSKLWEEVMEKGAWEQEDGIKQIAGVWTNMYMQSSVANLGALGGLIERKTS